MSRRHKKTVTANDAFSNPVFRLGYGTQAPIEGTEYPLTRMTDNYALLNSLYRGNWVAQNVIDIIPSDMLREGFSVGGAVSPEDLAELERVMRRTQLRDRIKTGLCWGRLYGGAAGLVLIDGQEDLSRPLELEAVLPGSYRGLYILDRWTGITPDMELVDDPGDPDFNLPAWYSITDANGRTAARVHHSRIVRFTGRQLPFLEAAAELWWGESELEALYDDLKKHDNVSNNLANLTFRANLDYMRIKDLNQILSMGGAEQQRRLWSVIQAQTVIRSNFGTQLIGQDDEIKNSQYTFTGLKDVYDAMCLDLCGASHIPATKLFGRSPAGLNATGESDLKNYNDYVDSLRESVLRPILERVLPVLMMSAWGTVPDDFTVIFPPLDSPSGAELSRIVSDKADALVELYKAGIIDRGVSLQELKRLEGDTGMFGGIEDADVDAARGQMGAGWEDLRDPLAGIPEVDAGPFERGLSLDYNPYHGPNGRFTSGGGGGKMKGTKYAPSPQRNHGGIQLKPKTYARLCGVLGTRYPELQEGEIRYIRDARRQYKVKADGYGGFITLKVEKIK